MEHRGPPVVRFLKKLCLVDSFDLDPQLLGRIVAEYREMPGLRLTVAHAARLWALDVERCRGTLDALGTTRLRESRRVTIEV